MFHALFRRLPLAASLVMLLTISLSFGSPTHMAFAKTQVPDASSCLKPTRDTCQHEYVMSTVNAPPGTIAAFGLFDQYHPIVGRTDGESLAELDMTDGTHMVEVGWVSLPGSTSSVIFVETRDLGNNTSCFVQLIQGTTNGWTCDFISLSATSLTGYKPGSPIPSDGTNTVFNILNLNSYVWVQLGGDWLGYITPNHWSGGSFGLVTFAQWFGEVAVTTPKATSTEMGDGQCGSATGSAKIFEMSWYVGQYGSGSYQPVNAPQSSLTATYAPDYNYGQFSGTGVFYGFTYGGPGAHRPPCQ